jgi:small basic protein
MPSVVDNLFGPLGRDYCIYFWALSVFGFVSLLIVAVPAVFYGLSKNKGLDYYLAVLFGVATYIIIYFQNRLLYSMCEGSMR